MAAGSAVALYLGGTSLAGICDGAIRPAMEQIEELWKEEVRGVMVEHRATSICVHVPSVLKQMIPLVVEGASLAIGGAPEDDPYLMPSAMAGMVLQEAG